MVEAFQAPRRRRFVWPNVLTVISAAILIGSEVFGAAFAGGWAIASLLGLGQYGAYVLQTVFFALGLAVMIAFMRLATRAEPFASYENSSGRGDGAG